jgi:hypothetical protein
MFKIISKKLFINLYYYNIVITLQTRINKKMRMYKMPLIKVLNRERTAKLIMFLSW